MWDRLLTDCHVMTLVPQPGDPLGIIRNAAIGIHEGRIVRVGRRTELAGTRAREVQPLGGAFVTPGLIDCHTHLVFAGTRAAEHAQRRAGATYEEIARSGGGIASTVAATAAAGVSDLLEQSRRRLRALLQGGVTTVEIKTGYGLDAASELRLLNVIRNLARTERVRIVPTLLALHALPAGADREAFVDEMVELVATVARLRLASSVDAFCETIAFTPDEVGRLFAAAADAGLPVRLHAEQLSNQSGAALAARHRALSADHLEHLDEAGARAMAEAGTVAVLLPGAFHTLQESRKPPVDLLRRFGVPMAVATDCNPGTSPLLVPQLAMHLACTLFELTPEEAIAGMTANAARALGLSDEVGRLQPGMAADLAVWPIADPAELGYWLGLMPERLLIHGQDL
jgi:imidazolonepropionase